MEDNFKKDEEFDKYRKSYLDSISNSIFPWEAAYYYYTQNVNRIDIMGIHEFQESILEECAKCESAEAAYQIVTLPMYDILDRYYDIQVLVSEDNKAIKLV